MDNFVSPSSIASNALLSIRNLRKVYGKSDAATIAVNDISLDICEGEFVAVMGPSGSGKTTLLNCIATIDTPKSGTISLDGVDVTSMRGSDLAKFRRESLGFIFQDTNLIETLNGYENIALALTLKGTHKVQTKRQVLEVANRFSIADVLEKFPDQMSGGQKQRVAAARAIVAHPRLVLADEPTGALDSRNSTIMLKTLEKMNRDLGATIMMVTHDAYAASYSSRTIFVKDGLIFSEIGRGNIDQNTYYNKILDVVTFLGSEVSNAI